MLRNRYQIRDKLGEGGMGEVFAAWDRLTGQLVALKRVLGREPASSPAGPLKTQREAGARQAEATQRAGRARYLLALAHEFRTLASLRHPNIIAVLDYGFDEEQKPYYTMELLQSPQTILAAGRAAPLPERLRLLGKLLRALCYLHRHGIIHREQYAPSTEAPQALQPRRAATDRRWKARAAARFSRQDRPRAPRCRGPARAGSPGGRQSHAAPHRR